MCGRTSTSEDDRIEKFLKRARVRITVAAWPTRFVATSTESPEVETRLSCSCQIGEAFPTCLPVTRLFADGNYALRAEERSLPIRVTTAFDQ